MNESRLSVHWNRPAIEGVVIVFSILLAFAIDAWWGERQVRMAEVRQLARVSAELNANVERIQRKLEAIAVAIKSTSEFISWMGPEPPNVQQQEFATAWSRMYSIGTFALMRGASEDFLAAGRIDTDHNSDVRDAVAELHSYSDDLERQYDLLRVAHANVGEYLTDSIPILHLDSTNAAMANHPTSRFPFKQADILSDPRVESRLSFYLIRLEFFSRQAQELLRRQAKLLVLIESTTGEEQPLDDAQVIENSYNDWVKVLNSRDIELWSSFLAPNAVFLPPGNPLLKTNKDIIDYYSALFGNPQFIGLKCSQDFAEVAGSRDIAWTRGTCNAFFRAESGAEESRTSKWTKVWVRLEDGTWKCRLNAWNFNESD